MKLQRRKYPNIFILNHSGLIKWEPRSSFWQILNFQIPKGLNSDDAETADTISSKNVHFTGCSNYKVLANTATNYTLEILPVVFLIILLQGFRWIFLFLIQQCDCSRVILQFEFRITKYQRVKCSTICILPLVSSGFTYNSIQSTYFTSVFLLLQHFHHGIWHPLHIFDLFLDLEQKKLSEWKVMVVIQKPLSVRFS